DRAAAATADRRAPRGPHRARRRPLRRRLRAGPRRGRGGARADGRGDGGPTSRPPRRHAPGRRASAGEPGQRPGHHPRWRHTPAAPAAVTDDVTVAVTSDGLFVARYLHYDRGTVQVINAYTGA